MRSLLLLFVPSREIYPCDHSIFVCELFYRQCPCLLIWCKHCFASIFFSFARVTKECCDYFLKGTLLFCFSNVKKGRKISLESSNRAINDRTKGVWRVERHLLVSLTLLNGFGYASVTYVWVGRSVGRLLANNLVTRIHEFIVEEPRGRKRRNCS